MLFRSVYEYSGGPRRRSLVLRRPAAAAGGRPRHYHVDLFLALESERPYALYHLTGPRSYNIRIRAYVKRAHGWRLNQYGVFYDDGADPPRRVRGSARIRTEADLAKFLGVTYYPPAARR